MERLAKYIAGRSVCSRREAERLILAGQVKVNGTPVDKCATIVGQNDTVSVRGLDLVENKPDCRMWLYHKPVGLITTHSDPQNRPTVFNNIKIPGYIGHVISVGRLDIDTEGLMLLVNNGNLSRILELPSSKILRSYNVYVKGRLIALPSYPGVIVDDDGTKYRVQDMKLLQNGNISISLYEGKKREVRNIMKILGLSVTRLIRVSYGPFCLGDIPVGGVVEVDSQAIDSLNKALSSQFVKPA